MSALRHARQDPLAFLRVLAARGDVVPFSLGRKPAFLLNHPAHIERVLVSDARKFDKGEAFEHAKRLLGNGLLTAEGNLHLERRRLVQPAFHRDRIDHYAETMVVCAERLGEEWCHGETVDLSAAMAKLTLSIVGRTLFGADMEQASHDVRQALATASACLDPLVSLVAPVRRVGPARDQLRAMIDRVIDERTEAAGNADDLLSLLMAGGEGAPQTRDQVRDDALTILAAGHDTIANALTWTWTIVAEHPEIEQKLHDEIAAVLGRRRAAACDLPRLTYTKDILAESLRLFPPAWVLARRAIGPYRVGTELMPAGSLVIMSQYLMHRDPRFFAEPLLYNPDRWMSDRQSSRPRMAYFPFGAGPRSCIGEGFAWTEGILLLATIAQRWMFRRAAGDAVELDPRITLRPKGNVLMVATKRPRLP